MTATDTCYLKTALTTNCKSACKGGATSCSANQTAFTTAVNTTCDTSCNASTTPNWTTTPSTPYYTYTINYANICLPYQKDACKTSCKTTNNNFVCVTSTYTALCDSNCESSHTFNGNLPSCNSVANARALCKSDCESRKGTCSNADTTNYNSDVTNACATKCDASTTLKTVNNVTYYSITDPDYTSICNTRQKEQCVNTCKRSIDYECNNDFFMMDGSGNNVCDNNCSVIDGFNPSIAISIIRTRCLVFSSYLPTLIC